MRTLLIDTSTERGIVALFEGDKPIEKIVLPFGYQNSHHVLPEIEKILIKNETTLKDLAFITVGVGPGSYTGMRVGAVIAKTLTYAAKIPLVGVSSLEGYVSDQDGKFAAIIDAKIGGAYFLKGQRIKETVQWDAKPQVSELQEIIKLMEVVPILVTPVAVSLKNKMEKLSDCKWTWVEMDPNPVYLVKKAVEKYNNKEYSTNGSLELLYLRKTQAEIEREQRKRSP